MALAVWLLPASVHIVGWPASGLVRVALLAPLWKLWWSLAATATLVVAVVVANVVVRRVRGAGMFQRIITVISPLSLLWLWTLPYLPWLPNRAPVLLALAGPIRWGIFGLALCGSAWTLLASSGWLDRPWRLAGRRAVFGVSLALYLCFGLRSAAKVGPGADEPHYLVITQSLLRDHDLAIENNHIRGDYREYFGAELHPDFLRRGLNDAIYSIHAPGLPALLVPAYAVAGYRGAVVMVCVFGALAALALFDLAVILGGPAVGWMTWASVCLTVPFIPHSWLLFPEMPGALVTAWAVLWMYQPLPARPATWIWRGVALAVLPWLHTKFVVLLVILAGSLLIRLWSRMRAAAMFLAPIAMSTGLWLFSFYRMYGVLDPQAPYGDSARTQLLLENIPRGILGLLVDQKFGLLAYSPVYLLAAVGCSAMLRRADLRQLGIVMLVTFVAFVGSTTRYYMWWGGSSAPARFLVPALPLVAPMIAVAFRELRSQASRATAALLLAFSVLVAVGGSAWPERFMLFSAPHGFAKLVEAAQAGSPLAFALPTFTQEDVRAPLAILAPWVLAGVLGLIVGVLASRFTRRLAGFHAACAGIVTFVLGGAAAAGAPAPAAGRATAMHGRLELMRAYDGPRLHAFDYAHGVTLDDPRLFELGSVSASRASGELDDDPTRLAGPFDLPPGRFTARIWFSGERTHDGTAVVTIDNRFNIASSEGPLTNPTLLSFNIPVDAAIWVAVSDEALAKAAQRVEIATESVVPLMARPAVEVHALEPVDGRAGAYIVYADRKTYPERGVFWTRGTAPGTVFVAPGGASTLVLTLHVGPVGGTVRINVAGRDHFLDLSHDQTRQIEVPLTAGNALVPVTVQAPGQFRPSEHEAGSTDERWLGCEVRIGLR